MKNNDQAIRVTRKELRKQCILGTILFGIMGYVIPYDSGIIEATYVFFGILAGIILGGMLLIYSARRGIWVCLYRAGCLFIGFGNLSLSALYYSLGFSPKYSYDSPTDRVTLLVLLLAVLLAVAAYFLLWIRPYWRDTYDLNLRRKKIDLQNGLYSVTTRWAMRGSSSSTSKIIAGSAVPIFAGLGVAFSRASSSEFLWMLIPSLFLLWLALVMGLIEIYNALQIRKIEKEIDRPLLIDAYVR